MLTVFVPKTEFYDNRRERFIYTKATTLKLEHSLISLSKWESKWCKPFLDKNTDKTPEQMLDYIRCMSIDEKVDPNVFEALTEQQIKDIFEYIDRPMTATWFAKDKGPRNREIVTAEIIYYWMVALQIPFECQKWHLNRLITLIKVCSIKQQPAKKMGKRNTMAQNKELNAARRRARNSKG